MKDLFKVTKNHKIMMKGL